MNQGSSNTAKAVGEPFVIAGWRVDPASLRISNAKHTIKLEPKVMAVLDYLACRPNTVVTRQTLEDEVWAGTIVGYDALSNAIIKLRKAFGDKARKPHIIETISKTGYRLIAEVSLEEVETEPNKISAKPTNKNTAMDDSGTVPCPYPGMLPFSAADSQYFYGRENEIMHMVQLLRHQRFMMVIGPSGSGKSSLVYAGLLPKLVRSQYFDKNFWLIRSMRPGSFPNDTIAQILGTKDNGGEFKPDSLATLLETHKPAQRLLLLVDQFEELFTQVGREQQARFIATLQALRASESCALVLTLRADFYPDLMNSYLWPVDASQRVEVATLRGGALREAIERPAADVGVSIENKLVDQLLMDAADEPGVLPLLQEAMGLLWDDLDQHKLSYIAYERLSRVTGESSGKHSGLAVAIAMKADATLAELNPSQQAIARRIFLRLIQFGEGRADTRRQQPITSLRATNDPEDEFEKTLEQLTANRLLTLSGGDDDNPSVVDISHESLIDSWSRLQDWADERREAELIRRRLEGKALEWVRLGKGSGGLLDVAALPEAERWLVSADAQDLGFDVTLPELVKASQQALKAAEQAREDAREKELRQADALAEEQQHRIEEQGHAAGRMRRSMMGLAAVFIVAVGAAIFAWTQSQKAQSLAEQEASAREEAEARSVEAENAQLASIAQLLLIQARQQQASFLDERGALLARQAYSFTTAGTQPLKAQVDSVLRAVAGEPHFSSILRRGFTTAIAFSPDGTKLASAHAATYEVLLWDLTNSGSQPIVLPDYPSHTTIGDDEFAGYAFALTFSPDGKTLTAANADGAIGQWDLDNPQAPFVELPVQTGGVWSLAYSPDGRWLAMGNKLDDAFTVWDLSQPDTPPVLVNDPQPAAPGSGPRIQIVGGVPVAFSPDSSTLATGSLEGIIRLWRPGEFTAPVASLRGHEGGMLALAFSNNGKHLASSGQDTTIRLWNLEEPLLAPVTLESKSAPVSSLDFNANDNILVSASANSLKLWQVNEPEEPPVQMTIGLFFQAMFSPDGKHLASAGAGHDHLTLWDMEPRGRSVIQTGHQGGILALDFSSDGELLASGGSNGDGSIRLWRWGDPGAPPTVLRGHKNTINSLDFSADGNRLVSASWNDDSVQLWDLTKATPTFKALPMPGSLEPWTALFHPDGKTLAVTGNTGAFAWDLNDLDTEATELLRGGIWGTEIAFSPNGNAIALGDWGPVTYLQDLSHPEKLTFELHGHTGDRGAWSLDFSPDGKLLATGGKSDATIRLWDPEAPETPSIVLGRHDSDITRVRFSPDGKQLASASDDRSVRLWNVEMPGALPIVLSGHTDRIGALVYSPDGKQLVSAGHDNKIRVWDLTHPLNASTTQEIAEMICRKVWRNLTIDEWHKFVSIEFPYERTCPNLPIHPSLFETAEKLAKENDIEGAVNLLKRAVELDPELTIDPQQEAQRLANSNVQGTE